MCPPDFSGEYLRKWSMGLKLAAALIALLSLSLPACGGDEENGTPAASSEFSRCADPHGGGYDIWV